MFLDLFRELLQLIQALFHENNSKHKQKNLSRQKTPNPHSQICGLILRSSLHFLRCFWDVSRCFEMIIVAESISKPMKQAKKQKRNGSTIYNKTLVGEPQN